MSKRVIDGNSPFYQCASDTIEEWSQKKFFGIKTDSEALDKIESEFKAIANQQRVIDRQLKTLGVIISKNSFGIEAFLPKVEEECLNTAAVLLKMATILRKWNNRYKQKD